MQGDALRKVRKELKDTGRSKGETADYYLQHILDLRRRMNEAKVAAMREAEEPFLEELAEIEIEYAVFLKMSS